MKHLPTPNISPKLYTLHVYIYIYKLGRCTPQSCRVRLQSEPSAPAKRCRRCAAPEAGRCGAFTGAVMRGERHGRMEQRVRTGKWCGENIPRIAAVDQGRGGPLGLTKAPRILYRLLTISVLSSTRSVPSSELWLFFSHCTAVNTRGVSLGGSQVLTDPARRRLRQLQTDSVLRLSRKNELNAQNEFFLRLSWHFLGNFCVCCNNITFSKHKSVVPIAVLDLSAEAWIDQFQYAS